VKTFEVIFKEFADSETFVMSRALLEDYKRQAALAERARILKFIEEEATFEKTNGYRSWILRPYEVIERIESKDE